MKKTAIVAIMLVLLMGSVSFAQGGWGLGYQGVRNDEVSAEMAPILEQMEELRAQLQEVRAAEQLEYLETLVEAGELSADRLEWMKQGWALAEEEGSTFTKGGFFRGFGRHCHDLGTEEVAGGRWSRRMPRR